jgi:hypothetical protein
MSRLQGATNTIEHSVLSLLLIVLYSTCEKKLRLNWVTIVIVQEYEYYLSITFPAPVYQHTSLASQGPQSKDLRASPVIDQTIARDLIDFLHYNNNNLCHPES